MTHYCPSCGAYSWHDGSGSAPWALVCPGCGHVAKQHPHPPDPAPDAPVEIDGITMPPPGAPNPQGRSDESS